MKDSPYAPPLEVEPTLAASETPYPTRVLCVLAFMIAGLAALSVGSDLPSIVSPFPIMPLVLREKFDLPVPLISAIAGLVYALAHARHLAGMPSRKPSVGLTVVLVCMTAFSVLYFFVDFSVGLEVRGLTHTALVFGYNVGFAAATWVAWCWTRTPGRYRSQVVFGTLLFAWLFWCALPYLGEV